MKIIGKKFFRYVVGAERKQLAKGLSLTETQVESRDKIFVFSKTAKPLSSVFFDDLTKIVG